MRQSFDLSDYLWPDAGQGRLPAYPVGPNRDWAPAFAVATFGGGLRDAVTENSGALSAAAKLGLSGHGLSVMFPSGSCYASLPTKNDYNLLGALTLVWVGVIDTIAQYQFLIARAAGSGGLNNPFEFRVNSGGGMQLLRANGSGYSTWATAQSPPVGRPVVLVATHGGNLANAVGASLWINGVSYAVTPTYTTSGAATGNTEELRLGTRGDTYTYMLGSAAAAFGFPRVLSDAEIRAISGNPALVFDAPLSLPMPAASGGAAVLEGAASGAASASGALTTGIPIAGAALSVTTASGSLAVGIPLAGAAASMSAASGNLTAQITLAGSAIAQAVSSALLSSGITMTAAAVAQAAADGTLVTAIQLLGSAQAQAGASGSLTAPSGGLEGNAQAAASASASLSTQIRLSGSAIAQAAASGSLSGSAIDLAGAAVSTASASGELTVNIALTAQALASAIASGSLTAQIRLDADAAAQAQAGAQLAGGSALVIPAARQHRIIAAGRRPAAIQTTRR